MVVSSAFKECHPWICRRAICKHLKCRGHLLKREKPRRPAAFLCCWKKDSLACISPIQRNKPFGHAEATLEHVRREGTTWHKAVELEALVDSALVPVKCRTTKPRRFLFSLVDDIHSATINITSSSLASMISLSDSELEPDGESSKTLATQSDPSIESYVIYTNLWLAKLWEKVGKIYLGQVIEVAWWKGWRGRMAGRSCGPAAKRWGPGTAQRRRDGPNRNGPSVGCSTNRRRRGDVSGGGSECASWNICGAIIWADGARTMSPRWKYM